MKNDYEIRGEITAIFLNSPKYGPMETIISTSQLNRVLEFPNTWLANYNEHTKSFYAVGGIKIGCNKHRKYGLHQWLKYLPKGVEIDHKNHDTLDNTDDNLRVLTRLENSQNRRGPNRNNRSSGYRGVTWNKAMGKWKVRMKINKEYRYFGSFDSLEKAIEVAKRVRMEQMPYSEDAM